MDHIIYGIADRKINEKIIVLPVKIRCLNSERHFLIKMKCTGSFKKSTPKNQDVCIFGKNALSKKSGLSRFCQTDLVQKIRTSVIFSRIASEVIYRHDVEDIR